MVTVLVNPEEPEVVIADEVKAKGVPVAALVEIETISLAVAGERVVPDLDQ